MADLFNEDNFRAKVVQAIELAGGPTNAAAKSGISKSVLSRIISGKKKVSSTETYFRLYKMLTGQVPPQ